MNVTQRKLLLGFLVAAFAVQTSMVYADETAAGFSPLSEEAVRGRQLWHKHNCQSCHQIHGFGGFLGPDLTNAAARLTDDRLEEVLTVGSLQMPAFHLDEDEILDLAAFLDELGEMGVGVPRSELPLDVPAVHAAIDARLAECNAPADVQRGLAAFRQNCMSCHVPLQSTPLGLQTAPDLTTACDRLDDAALRDHAHRTAAWTAACRRGSTSQGTAASTISVRAAALAA